MSEQKRRHQVQLQALEGVYIDLIPGICPKGGPVWSANHCPSGLVVSENGLIVLAKVPGAPVAPEGEDGYGAAALTCFLIILSGPLVGGHFKKTLS